MKFSVQSPAQIALPEPTDGGSKADTSSKDPLTGLYSEAAFTALLNREIDAATYRETAQTLALLQLANFYEIRTWVGGAEANLLLNDIARLLAQTVPEGTIICRCHRHEFAILLTDDGSRKALLIADRIKQVAQTCNSQVIPPQLSLLCGVGVTRINDSTPCADVAFARARHNLSRQQRDESAALTATDFDITEQSALLERLGDALKNNQMGLNFQAIISFKPVIPERYEIRSVLLDRQVQIPAGAFIDTAVQNALGQTLDRWVITQAISRLGARPDNHVQFVINLTQNSVASTSFLVWLENYLADFGSVAARLILQISELDILISQHHMGSFSRNLKRLGIRLSISHFGCTPKPLRYLGLMHVDCVKLDHSLYSLPGLDMEGRRYLEQLIVEIHQRNMQVIAPMVEQVNTLPILWQAGVDFIQGNGLHKPGESMDYEFVKQRELTVC